MMSASPDPLWPSYRAGARLTVDLGAIASNYRYLQSLAAKASCAAVVKADAYGLGIEHVAPVLEDAGATEFFVAHVDEGIRLRSVISDKARITVLHGPRHDAAGDCVRYGLRPVLNSLDQIAVWRSTASQAGKPLEAALQVDSGMSRFGLSRADLDALHEDKGLMEGLRVSLVMSHLACADMPDHPANTVQKKQMLEMSAQLPSAPLSLSASSGIFLGPDYHLDVVRPGAALYGLAPNQAAPNPLSPVVRLQAHVLQIREVGPGDGVGYGLTYRPDQPRRIATVAAGYADGFSRHGAGKGCAWFEDIRLPILGRVSMDSLIVDISDVPDGKLGPDMMVDLIGPRRSVDDVAEAAGTIGYEVLTSLGHRFHREYVGNREASLTG
ncbi:alanine racemase [Gluconobacter sp. Dm-62]|uniref:alanine racemase n=1 Tax=Gluconobacter sp. Dm-62 TaxID=2799804 RepID=UPI001B8B3A23|nr:alanine racemase [Gluconobacter sp. Dm-62]MBS1104250.1 alanine racemase [Gluconobacter sp. Dm-62]